MQELIKITTSENGQQLVSARDLYLGLGLNEKNWARWYPKNIQQNEYFNEGYDFIGVRHNVEGSLHDEENLGGRPTLDFAISLDFAKHIAMMARTEKSHQYRNYFILCEKQLREPKQLTALEQLQLQNQAILEINEKVDTIKNDMPLFKAECDELIALVRKIGMKMLGGKPSQAYKNNSLRGKIYADIQHQLRREFGVDKYAWIKHSQFEHAKEIVRNYKLPTVLEVEILEANSQIEMEVN